MHHDARVGGRIYSVGYEGLTTEGLVELLTGARVTTVVDVRLNPISRKPGFSRRRLEATLADAGIEYVHEKDLGNPVDNRAPFKAGDTSVGRERMRQILDDRGSAAIGRVVERAARERVALLCVEREHERCHRAVIAEAAVERRPAIEILVVGTGVDPVTFRFSGGRSAD